MHKIINLLLLLFIFYFLFIVYKYYSSSININTKNFNRLNVEEILKEKVSFLPVLNSDTENVIEFNDSFENEINDRKKLNFWELLLNK